MVLEWTPEEASLLKDFSALASVYISREAWETLNHYCTFSGFSGKVSQSSLWQNQLQTDPLDSLDPLDPIDQDLLSLSRAWLQTVLL